MFECLESYFYMLTLNKNKLLFMKVASIFKSSLFLTLKGKSEIFDFPVKSFCNNLLVIHLQEVNQYYLTFSMTFPDCLRLTNASQ